jgi:molybdate-binding protein
VPVVWTILDGELAVAEAGRAAPDFACDGFLDPNEGWVQEVYGGRDPAATLFVAGCDPFLKWVWRRTPHPDLELYIFPMGSQPAIEALSQREVHIAGTHLFDPVSRSYNGQVQHLPFATRRWQYTYWESGRMGAMGETEGWALREVGSEARAAYERQFDPEWRMHVHTRSVELDSHWAIGRYLRNHPGFAGVGIRPVAEALGIPFTLWSQEPYEWVTRAEWADDPRVSAFEHWLQSPAVGSLLESLPGLTAWQPGTRIR